jgi:hypothetical protein
MSNPTAVATAVLLSCVAIIWMLSRTKLLGTLALTGFALGCLATAAVFILLG